MATTTITASCSHIGGTGTGKSTQAAQGGHIATTSSTKPASIETRTGYIDFNLSELKGKIITGVKVAFYRNSSGKHANRYISMSPGGGFYSDNDTTTTITYGSDVISLVQSKANSGGTMRFTMNNDETAVAYTERDANDKIKGYYTENYAKITSATMTITYANSYTVSYELANSLTSGQSIIGSLPSSDTVVEGSSYTIKNCTAKKLYGSGTYTVNFNWNTTTSDSNNWATRTVKWESVGGFAGYWQGSTSRNPGDFITVNSDITLSAVFYVASPEATDSVSFPSDPTRTGYKFNGWATSRSGKPISSYTPTDNATLYAIWELEKYTITYDANGGSVSPDREEINPGNSTTLPTPIRSGYKFNGWYTYGGTKIGNGGASYKPTASITLYAHWLQQYTITYNANGGSGAPNDDTKIYGQALTLSSKEPTKADSFSDPVDTPIIITYNANGGSSTPSSGSGTKTTITTTSYKFSKWTTNKNGSGDSYSAGGSYTANAGATLYAQYTSSTSTSASDPSIKTAPKIDRLESSAGSYTVAFNANGGTCSTTTKSASRTTSYTFEGWNTNTSGTGTNYNANTYYYFSDSDTLYAKWSSSTSTASITLPNAERTGYTFKGWSTNPTATSGRTGSYTPTGNETLYAIWAANSYSVKFNGNGSTSGTMSNQSFTYGSAQALTANIFKREYTVTYNYNYSGSTNTTAKATATFNGWATSATGAKKYNDKESVSNLTDSGTYDLYANWTLGSVTLPAPGRTGYNFKGWATTSTATSGKTGSYTPQGNITLYAIWEVANFITTITRYISDSATGAKQCEVYYYIDDKWMPIEEIWYYTSPTQKIQVGEQIPYIEP